MSYYLSISYKALITNKVFHYILFFIECYLLFLQILEIYCNNYISFIKNDIISFSPLTKLLISFNIIQNNVKMFIYAMLILIATICIYVPAFIRLRLNIFTKILINLSDLLFCRILTLFLFNYLLFLKILICF